jgi:hypothetical protein
MTREFPRIVDAIVRARRLAMSLAAVILATAQVSSAQEPQRAPESVNEALAWVEDALQAEVNVHCGGWVYEPPARTEVTRSEIAVTCHNQRVFRFRYRDLQPQHPRGGVWTCLSPSRCVGALGEVHLASRDRVARFRAAWEYLRHPPPPREPTTDSAFLQSLEQSRAVGHDRSEAMRRVQVQAQALIAAGHTQAAFDAYSVALAEMPDWALGHYNLALVSARLEYYADAITAMRRFLYLEPNGHPAAADARAAQDRIYEWEALLVTQ